MNEFIVIIPSRLSSTRLKEKALLDLNGKSLIERVYLRAIQSNAKEVFIATDSNKIEDHVKKFSSNVILTSTEHKSGTDRVHECATKLDVNDDTVIVNVQGDEPFINPETINKTADIIFNNTNASVGSACTLFMDNDLHDVNNVKVSLSNSNRALYFSRNVIPNNFTKTKVKYLQHVGIYSYNYKTLSTFVSLSRSKNETSENLEQLRFLDNGYDIYLEEIEELSIGIDTETDYKKALKILNEND
jgi:3-deoxy-manno-octulosonate cytidylyltransferase (CMP-KDO synthetase)